LVESDSGSKWADKAFQRYGYNEYVDRKNLEGVNISLTNLTKSPLTKFDFEGAYFKNPELPVNLKDVPLLSTAPNQSPSPSCSLIQVI